MPKFKSKAERDAFLRKSRELPVQAQPTTVLPREGAARLSPDPSATTACERAVPPGGDVPTTSFARREMQREALRSELHAARVEASRLRLLAVALLAAAQAGAIDADYWLHRIDPTLPPPSSSSSSPHVRS